MLVIKSSLFAQHIASIAKLSFTSQVIVPSYMILLNQTPRLHTEERRDIFCKLLPTIQESYTKGDDLGLRRCCN